MGSHRSLRCYIFAATLTLLAVLGVSASALAAQVTEVIVHRVPGIERITVEPSGMPVSTDVTPSYWMRFKDDGSACLVGSWNYKPAGKFVGHYSHFSDLANAVNTLGFLNLPVHYPSDGSVVLDTDYISVWVEADGKTHSVRGPLFSGEPTPLKKLLTLIDKIASSIHWTTTNASCP